MGKPFKYQELRTKLIFSWQKGSKILSVQRKVHGILLPPIDTSNAKSPGELTELHEQIAENIHNVWTAGRIEEGQTYGPVKSEEKRKTQIW